MVHISDLDRARFAGLVAKAWADEDLANRFESEPQSVLAEHGIALPKGVPVPVIPPRPEGIDIGTGWRNVTFEHWDIRIEKLPESPELSVSSLACVACPYSCFSSISN